MEGYGRSRSPLQFGQLSERLRAEDCVALDALQLGHGSPDQFLSMAESLIMKGRAPDASRDALFARQIEIAIERPGHDAPRHLWITVVPTRVNFGGIRQWFLCPRCSRRVRKLYFADGREGMACRHCLRLVYRSQYASRHPLAVHFRRMKRLYPELFPKSWL
jgi:hypothetical protein